MPPHKQIDVDLKNKLLITIIDKGLLAVLVGVILLIGQYWITNNIEDTKNKLAYRNTVAERRITRLEELWDAVNTYGEAVKTTLSSTKASPDLTFQSEKKLYETLSKSGVYLGLPYVNDLKDSLSLKPIVTAIQSGGDIKEVLAKFQKSWISALSSIEKKLASN